eukprot:3990372-Prymnesium_polylepis.1
MPTVSSFSRQPQRVVRARRREKRPFTFCLSVTPCLDAREAERLLLTVSLLDRSVRRGLIICSSTSSSLTFTPGRELDRGLLPARLATDSSSSTYVSARCFSQAATTALGDAGREQRRGGGGGRW